MRQDEFAVDGIIYRAVGEEAFGRKRSPRSLSGCVGWAALLAIIACAENDKQLCFAVGETAEARGATDSREAPTTAPGTNRPWQEAQQWLAGQAATRLPGNVSPPMLPEVPPHDPEERLAILAQGVASVGGPEGKTVAKLVAGEEIGASEWELVGAWGEMPKAVRQSLTTVYALLLLRRQHFDEALRLVSEISPEDTVAPEAVLYCRTVAHFQLGQGPEAVQAAQDLLRYQTALPRRYQLVAEVVVAEASQWGKNPLRQVSQLMGDVTRRLSLARPDPALVPTQDKILAMLDELIDKAEQSRKKMKAVGSGGTRSASPAEESLPLGGKGPGEVSPRSLSGPSDWGALPPKEREEALQIITRRFAPHYRQVIEQYFRRLAQEAAGAPEEDGRSKE